MRKSSYLEPKQSRSQQTLDRILRSSTKLISEESYSDVTIAQIAQRAEISVGGFYSRFENKEALFFALKNRFANDTKKELARVLEKKDEIIGLRNLLNFVIDRNAQLYNQYRGVLIVVHLKTRVLESAQDVKKAASYNDEIATQLEALLMSKRSEITHRQPRVAVRIAIACFTSMLRDAIVFGNVEQYPAPGSHTVVVRHVTNVVCRFLGAK